MDLKHEFAAFVLKRMRKKGIIQFCDESRHELADLLCEWVITPWFWTEADILERLRKDRKVDNPTPEVLNAVKKDLKLTKVGFAYPLKGVPSIARDYRDFLMDTENISEVFGTDEDITKGFHECLVEFGEILCNPPVLT